MNALDKLILLVPRLTKSEKRAFTLAQKDSDYHYLYQLILENQNSNSTAVANLYQQSRPNSNTNVTAIYLYDRIIDTLCSLEERKNTNMQLLHKLHASKVLMRKSFFTDALELIREVMTESKKHKNNEIFLMASQAELDLLLKLDFVGLREDDLAKRHRDVEETILAIRKSEGLGALYDILKYRTYHYDIMRSEEQKNKLNKLLTSEVSLNSSIDVTNFEALKFHQLFQATYLMGVHNYKAALRSLKELINIFKENPSIWDGNKYYFIEAIETALKGLRCSKQYGSIEFFLSELDFVKTRNTLLISYIYLLKLQYRTIPHIDMGEFQEAYKLIQVDKATALKHLNSVSIDKQAELTLYIAIVEFGMKNYHRVKEVLNPIIFKSKHYNILPIIRTIRLINLMAIYELGEIDDFDYEVKSLKRSLGTDKQSYKTESLVIKYIQRPKLYFSLDEKNLTKWKEQIYQIRQDVYERQLLKIFDFTKWIEAKLTKTPLSDVLKEGIEVDAQ